MERSNDTGDHEEWMRLANAGDFYGLAAVLAPSGQALPDPDRLYRGLGLDDAGLVELVANLAAGRGVPARETYTKGLARGKHPVVVEFDRPAEGVIDMGLPPGINPFGVHEFVILGGIPGAAVRSVWIEGRRFTPQECVALAAINFRRSG